PLGLEVVRTHLGADRLSPRRPVPQTWGHLDHGGPDYLGVVAVDRSTTITSIAMDMRTAPTDVRAEIEFADASNLERDPLEAWPSYRRSPATIRRLLDAELVSEHGITTRDYEVLLYLAQAPDRKLPMSALAESTMLTRSGITRLVDGLVAGGFIERAACP